jgi:hypothetical protein
MISVHFDATPVIDFKLHGDNDTFKKFFHGLLQEEFILRHQLMKLGLLLMHAL